LSYRHKSRSSAGAEYKSMPMKLVMDVLMVLQIPILLKDLIFFGLMLYLPVFVFYFFSNLLSLWLAVWILFIRLVWFLHASYLFSLLLIFHVECDS